VQGVAWLSVADGPGSGEVALLAVALYLPPYVPVWGDCP
jgi:hypothetical protein